MHSHDLWNKNEYLRTEYLACQNIIPLGTFLLGSTSSFIRSEADSMAHSLLILLLFSSPLIVLLAVRSVHMVWYHKLRRWIWHRRTIKKIEKKLNAHTQGEV